MSRSRKKTVSQQIMSVTALALPAPIRDVVVSRWGARLSLLAAAALAASGVLTVQWTDGKPKVQVNRERAVEVEHKLEAFAEERATKFQESHREQPTMADRLNFFKTK